MEGLDCVVSLQSHALGGAPMRRERVLQVFSCFEHSSYGDLQRWELAQCELQWVGCEEVTHTLTESLDTS